MLGATSYLSGQTGCTPSTFIEAPPLVPLIFIVIVEQAEPGVVDMTIAHTPKPRCLPAEFLQAARVRPSGRAQPRKINGGRLRFRGRAWSGKCAIVVAGKSKRPEAKHAT